MSRVSGVKRFTREVKALGFDVRRKAALGGAVILGIALNDEWLGRQVAVKTEVADDATVGEVPVV